MSLLLTKCKTTGLVLNGEANVSPVAPASLVDKSRWGNNGVFTNITMVQLPSGLWVYRFNGTNSHIGFGNPLSLQVQRPFGIEIWINADNAQAGTQKDMFSKWSGPTFVYDHGLTYRGNLMFRDTGGVLRSMGVAITISALVWHHWFGFYDGTWMRVYLDAVLVGSNNIGLVTPQAGGNLEMGVASALTPGTFWAGMATFPRFYGYAPSPGYILQRFEENRHWFGR